MKEKRKEMMKEKLKENEDNTEKMIKKRKFRGTIRKIGLIE